MKKLLLACVILALSITSASAALNVGAILDTIPMNQGVVYSLKDSEFAHVSSAVIMSRGDFSFEAGYMDNGKILTSLSYKLLDMKKYIEIPILKELFVRPGLYLGFDELNTGDPKVDYGISFTCLEVQW